MQKQRIPPNQTTKQEILSLRRMGFPAQKKMEHMEKEIYARQKNLRESDKQMAANHIWMPPPSFLTVHSFITVISFQYVQDAQESSSE